MGVFLTILKILGLVIAGIVGLVLFIILLIILFLFTVPVKYNGRLAVGEKTDFEVTVHWLLNAVYARLKGGSDEEMLTEVHLLGINIPMGGELTLDMVLDVLFPPVDDETIRKENEEDLVAAAAFKADFNRVVADESDFIEEEAAPDTFLARVADFFLQKTEGLRTKYRKLKRQKRFLSREKVKSALRKILDLVIRVVKTVFPKTIQGRLHIGMDNPADTGNLLGYLSMALPITQDRLTVEPDFTQQAFDGELEFSTGVRVGRLIYEVVRFILNKDVRYFMARFRKYL